MTRTNLLLAGFGVFLALSIFVIAEGFFGVILHFPPDISVVRKSVASYYATYERDILQFNPNCARYDKEIAYTLKPGKCTFNNREFKTTIKVNSIGVRDTEESLQNPQIIFLGDSHSMGWGVEQSERFSDLTGKLTDKSTLTIAVPSFGTVRSALLLQKVSKPSIETVVVQYSDNDFEENSKFLEWENELSVMQEHEYYNLSAYYQNQRTYYPGKYIYRFTPMLFQNSLKRVKRNKGKSDEEDPRNYELEIKALHNILNLIPVVQENVNLIVLEINSFGGRDPIFLEKLSSVVSNGSLRFKNVIILDVLKELERDDFYLFDTHMRETGHQKVATMIAGKILSQS